MRKAYSLPLRSSETPEGNVQPSPLSMIGATRGGYLKVAHSGSGGLGRFPEEEN